MDSAVPYLSAKDDYSLFNVYKHTALKTYSPFLRNQDFLNPCSHGDMENIKAVITPSKPHVSLANTPVHSSSTSTAFHNQGLEKERGISSGDARLEVFSDRCDINGFPVKTKDKDEAETILQSDGISHCCSVRHCNNCTDGNIWVSSTSRQTSVALSDLDIRKGKKRIFIRKEWPSIKDTSKDQKKRRCYSQKRKSAITQKTADPAASAKELPNDFIHVRASRGQARDSHSLAERARTEKINKRLRILKDLVPGCPKKVGKAVLLEELINYVQTLHKQIKVLSMKVAALSPPHDSSVELTTSAKEPLSQQPLVEDGGVLVPSFSFSGTSHDSKIKRASTSPFG